MRSAAFTDKVIAFSRTLRLRGKNERRNATQEEEARRRQKEIKTISARRQIKRSGGGNGSEKCEKKWGDGTKRGCATETQKLLNTGFIC